MQGKKGLAFIPYQQTNRLRAVFACTKPEKNPQAYKPISIVVEALVDAGITRKVARIAPLAVIKGEDD